MIGDDGLTPSAEQKMEGIEIPWKIFWGLLYTEYLSDDIHTFPGNKAAWMATLKPNLSVLAIGLTYGLALLQMATGERELRPGLGVLVFTLYRTSWESFDYNSEGEFTRAVVVKY